MNLEFIKEGNIWVAEFEATSDFNLHIERVDDGLLKVMQRGTTEGEYVNTDIWDAGKPCYKNFDRDVAAFVYPKWIKVISGTEVITASVNFNEGGGSGSGSDGNVNLASFSVLSFTWEYEEGMTWKEFYASKYCIPKYDETTDTVYNIIRDSYNGNMPRICANAEMVGNLYDDITTENDVIINGHTYKIDD